MLLQCKVFKCINMTDEKLFLLISKYQRYLNSDDLTIVTNFLRDKSDNHFLFLNNIQLKNPMLGICFSLVFGMFGVGAFYVNKKIYGIAQLISYIIFISIYIIHPEYHGADIYEFWFGYHGVIYNEEGFWLIGSLILYCVLFIVGIINVQKWAKDYNFKKIMEYITTL